MPAEHSTPECGRAGLRGLSSQLFVASLRTACQAQAASRVLARLVVVPGGAGWARSRWIRPFDFFDRLETPAAGPAWVSNNACQESLSAWLLCRRFFDTEPSADLPLFPALWFLLIRPSLTRTRANTPAGCPIPRRDCGRQEVYLWDAIGDTDLLPCVRRFSLPRPTTEPVLRTCHQCVILFDEQVPR